MISYKVGLVLCFKQLLNYLVLFSLMECNLCLLVGLEPKENISLSSGSFLLMQFVMFPRIFVVFACRAIAPGS